MGDPSSFLLGLGLTVMHTAAKWRHTALAATRHTIVVIDVGRALLTKVAEVVVELYGEVATDSTIPCVLSKTTTYGTSKGCVLVQEVIHTDEHLALLVLEELLTEVYVAK